MVDSLLDVEVDRGLYKLTMRRAANALDEELIQGLIAALEHAAGDGFAPVLLLSAHPRLFSPGWDLKLLADAGRDRVRAFLELFDRLILALFSHPGPTAVAIGGHAIAGGCLLALACDVRVMASSGARIGLSEVNLGVPVPAPCVRMLRARLSAPVVADLLITGDGYPGERAAELAIVDRALPVESVARIAEAELRTLAAKPRAALVDTKQFLYGEVWQAMAERREDEERAFVDGWFSDETQDRIAALARTL